MVRTPCCDKNGLKKGPWTPDEDMKLIQYIQIHGPGNWRTLPKHAGLQRCGKSCRLRWTNYLRPDIRRGRFSFEEEETIIQLHSVLGNKWSAIAARLPGRTDNEIKNYWNTHIRKRLLRMGIDPVTHAPRLDLLDLSALLNSPQLNLSNLIRLQTLLNPEVLKLALNLLSSNNNNQSPDFLLQKLQESNHHSLNNNSQNQVSILPPNHYENIISQPIPSNPTIPSTLLNYPSMQSNIMGQYSTNSSGQMFQENDLSPNATNTGENSPESFPRCFYDQRVDLSENSSIQSDSNNNSNNNSLSFSFDNSDLSTPFSSQSPNLNHSASTGILMNGNINEDEREIFCSDLLRFEIPEILDFDDFI